MAPGDLPELFLDAQSHEELLREIDQYEDNDDETSRTLQRRRTCWSLPSSYPTSPLGARPHHSSAPLNSCVYVVERGEEFRRCLVGMRARTSGPYRVDWLPARDDLGASPGFADREQRRGH